MLVFKVSAVPNGPPKPMERWRGFKLPPKKYGWFNLALKMKVFLGRPMDFFLRNYVWIPGRNHEAVVMIYHWLFVSWHSFMTLLKHFHASLKQIKITSDSMVPYSVTPPEEIPLYEMIHQRWCCHCKIPIYEWWWWWWWWWWWYFLKDIETCSM